MCIVTVDISIVSHYNDVYPYPNMVDSYICLHSYVKMARKPVLRAVLDDLGYTWYLPITYADKRLRKALNENL